jgi:hypothetical protein
MVRIVVDEAAGRCMVVGIGKRAEAQTGETKMTKFKVIHSHTVDGDRTSEIYDTERKVTLAAVNINDDMWRILGAGTVVGNRQYLHLASTTRFHQKRNGRCPVQMCAWVDLNDLTSHQHAY